MKYLTIDDTTAEGQAVRKIIEQQIALPPFQGEASRVYSMKGASKRVAGAVLVYVYAGLKADAGGVDALASLHQDQRV